MEKKKAILVLLLLCMGLISVQCKSKKTPEEEASLDASFDKAGMLHHLGENIIVPSYSRFRNAIDSLQEDANLFVSGPSLATLKTLQEQFITVYLRYQRISTFEFGPADQELLRANFNTFPCDTTQINGKIAAGDLDFSAAADIDVKGLPALDFLLFKNNSNPEVLARFTDGSNAPNARNYLLALIRELKQKTDAVYKGWNKSEGNYLSAFKNNTGSNVGSSVGLLINQLNYDYEVLKNARIGIPLGKKSMGVPFPYKSEGVYSSMSLRLALEQLNSIESIYLGHHAGQDGPGLDDYLGHVNAKHPAGPLNEVIKNKFISAKAKLATVPETLAQSILSQPQVVDAAYAELQQLVILLKVDMPSALGIMITYEDNDGD